MTLFDASVHTVRARVRNLVTDMERWGQRTTHGGDLGRHRSQITRLRDYLGGAFDASITGRPIDPEVDPPFTGGIDQVADFRRSVGSLHLLWEFFRDKLAQRDVSAFKNHLDVADDLAWACYEPFLLAATKAHPETFDAAAVKEPPLVFYSTDRTPFTQARTKALHPAGLDAKDLEDFAAEIQRLPVPVIGMPWDIANRLPETTLVGHEAGHVVAEDLGLAAEARTAVREATLPDGAGREQRRTFWLAWCDEVFADVVGVLATGTAFVAGLAAEMVDERNTIRLMPITTDANGKPGRYPTPTLRMALCHRVLAGVGVAVPTDWTDDYGMNLVGSSAAYAADVPVIVTALLDRKWAALGDKRLTQVLPWTVQHEEDAHTVARKTLSREAVPVVFDVRRWVAAATHAYRTDPDAYAERDLDGTLAADIVERPAVRARTSRPPREELVGLEALPRSVDGVVDALRDADRRAGAALAQRLILTKERKQ